MVDVRALPPSMTLGCGSWGGNVTSDNVSPLHLMDIKRVAFETRPVKSARPAVSSATTAAPARPAQQSVPQRATTSATTTQPVAAGPGKINREEIAAEMRRTVHRFFDRALAEASIENALERMRQGQYGVCEGCGIAIPLARLNALPYATSCIECQRAAETGGGAGGGAGDWSRVLDTGYSDVDVSFSDLET